MNPELKNDYAAQKSMAKRLRVLTPLFTIAGIVLTVGAIMLGNPEMTNKMLQIVMLPAGILLLITAVTFHVIAIRKGWKLEQLVTDNVTARILSEVFQIAEYSPNKSITYQVMESARLIKDWNVNYGSDLVRGGYKGTNFAFSDVMLIKREESTDDEGRTTTTEHKRFKGQWIILETKKEMKGEHRLREKGKGERTKSSIETECMAFNAKFQIETYDPHGAFMVLTPPFMEAISHADLLADGKTYIFFKGRHIHIAIHNNRNLLEFCTKKSSGNLEALREEQKREIKYITDIMDVFLLNERLF